MPDNESHSTTTGSESGEVSFLGTIAKFASQPQKRVYDFLILKFFIQAMGRELMPHERIHKCLRAIVPGKRTVEIIYAPESKTAHYKNLQTCGSVWMCAVCAGRITEQRAQELQQGVTRWHTEGGFCALLTFTLRHNAEDDLESLLNAIRAAHRRFKAGRSWYQFTGQFCWHGSVTALEVTHGQNGWHPHLHELVFFEPMSTHVWKVFADSAKDRWTKVLAAEGRDATWAHGLDVRDTDQDVYDYISKYGREPLDTTWTVEREIAKAPVKKGSQGGRTPFQLLMDYGNGDRAAGTLFQEYAQTFKGRAQLFWSRGLRAELGLGDELPDDDLAAALPEEYIILASLNTWHWRQIIQLPDIVRAEIIVTAMSGDPHKVKLFLARHGVII